LPKQISQELKSVLEKSQQLNVPYVDLTGKIIIPDVLREVSEEAANFYRFVPIAKNGKVIEVGMVNPDDLKSREAINFIAQRRGLEPKIFIISLNDFENVLAQYRNLKKEVEGALKDLEVELAGRDQEGEKKKKSVVEDTERVMAEAPITKIVAVILRHAQEGRASDIHIEPTENEVKVRFRVDGVLYIGLTLPKAIQSAVVSRIKILSNLKIDESRVPQDGRFHSTIDGKKIDFRVSTFPTSFGEKVVLRLLDSAVGLMDFVQMGLDGYNLRVVKENISKPFGMILITGPTGSGKSTTLYAILNELNTEGVNIVSLEDPVEYYIKGVSQSQVKPEIHYTFASGLRSILRQDPDIIMVGEIRDSETAELATHAALTGHIVLSTLHTNNAVGVIPRLIDMGVSSFLIPSALNLSMSQRLVRRLCPECKKQVSPPPKISEMMKREFERISPAAKKEIKDVNLDDIKIWEAPGCKFCGKKGTKGRIAIMEALTMTPQLEEMIISGPNETKIGQEAFRQGMITMRQDGFIKVLKGMVSLEEVLKAVEE